VRPLSLGRWRSLSDRRMQLHQDRGVGGEGKGLLGKQPLRYFSHSRLQKNLAILLLSVSRLAKNLALQLKNPKQDEFRTSYGLQVSRLLDNRCVYSRAD
jgi:hypothetical protein